METAKRLIERGADLDAATDSGETALLRAVFWQDRQTVELLVTSGAKPDAVSDQGLTTAGFGSRAEWNQRAQDARAGR